MPHNRYYRSKKSLALNGTDEYLLISDSDKLSFGNGSSDSAFSITSWVWMTDATNFPIFTKADITNNVFEYRLESSSSDQLKLSIYDDNVTNYVAKYTTPTLTSYEKQWVHLACTYDGTGQSGIKLYINGSLQSMGNDSTGSYTAMSNTSEAAVIGADANAGAANFAEGNIKRVCVWNKVLTVSEIMEDISRTNTNLREWHSAKSNIVAYYEMEGDSTSVKDMSGNSLHATPTNIDSTNFSNAVPFPYDYQRSYNHRNQMVEGNDNYGGFMWNIDGATDYINLGNILNPATDSFSWGIWFSNTANLAGNAGMIQKSDAGLQFGLVMDSSEKIVAQIRQDGGNYRLKWSTNSYTDGKLHHAMIVFDNSTDTVKLYIDGIEDSGGSTLNAGSITSLTNTSNLHIGYANYFGAGAGGSIFNGYLGDPICFNRVLTAAEVLQIYNGHGPRDESKHGWGSSLVGYWRASNSTNTASGVLDKSVTNSNHGTMTNMEDIDISRTYPRAAYDGGSFIAGSTNYLGSFTTDGVNEYIIKSGFSVNGYAACAISIWVQKGNTGGYIFSMPETSAGTNGIDMYIQTTQLNSYVKGSSTAALLSGAGVVGNSIWHHCVLTYDGSNWRQYVDGILSGTLAISGTISLTANEINIGRFGTYGSYSSQKTNHFSVWNTNLSQHEIQELYNGGSPTDLTKHSKYSNCTLWWRMDQQDSATGTVTDRVGSNNGTPTNMEAGDLSTTIYPTN